jgi:cystathionine beta-synthase
VERGDVLEWDEYVSVQLDVLHAVNRAVRGKHAVLVLPAEQRYLDLLARVFACVVVRRRSVVPAWRWEAHAARQRARPHTLADVANDWPTILDLIGGTPIVRLQRVARGVPATVLAKLEYLNPGGSVKDRIGLRLIEVAERSGMLKPGGTIVEPTSGNTGVGLAIAAAHKGYRCIFVMPDKVSQEKIRLLRAHGAEVVVCPTAVPPDSRESYYSVSTRLAEEIPGAFKPDQYSNPANPQTHYETTGPEIWEQTEGRIDAVVLTVGTGGTITGVARYLRERKPDVLVVGADPLGSIYTSASVHQYLVEGIGEDFWPKTFDPSVVDRFVAVSDRDSFATARRLAREEGMLVGGSGGTAVYAALEVAKGFEADAVIVTLIPDSGRGYLSKFYDDNWLTEYGLLEREERAPAVADVLSFKRGEFPEQPELVLVGAQSKVGEAIELMQRYGISQIPVVRHEPTGSLADIVGSIRERGLLERIFRHREALDEDVTDAMEPPLPAVEVAESVDQVFAELSGGAPAIVVARGGAPVGVITRADLLEYLAAQRSSSEG